MGLFGALRTTSATTAPTAISSPATASDHQGHLPRPHHKAKAATTATISPATCHHAASATILSHLIGLITSVKHRLTHLTKLNQNRLKALAVINQIFEIL